MQERFREFTCLIANLNRCIYKIKAEEVADMNLKSSHVSCIYYLYKKETLTAKQLSDICGEDKANISRAIKYLEENGFLVCDSQMQKRYNSPLRLTEKGCAAAERIAKKIDAVLHLASEVIREEDRKIMYESLNAINENLNRLCSDYQADERETGERQGK